MRRWGNRLPLVLRLRGPLQLLLCELILDLYDLVHMATWSTEPVTLDTLRRVRGLRDLGAAERSFYRIKERLDPLGIQFELESLPGEPVRLVFDSARLRALVEREIGPACRVLALHRGRGRHRLRRFQGNARRRGATSARASS